MSVQAYRHKNSTLFVQWDAEKGNFVAEGRMRCVARYVADCVKGDTAEPWDHSMNERYVREYDREYYQNVGDWDRWDWANGGEVVASTMEEVQRLANEGWTDGVARLAKMASDVRESVPETEDITPRYVWAEQGDEFDQHRVWNGEMESMWWGRDETIAPGPRIITLITPVGGHCGLGADQLFWNGAAAVVLCDVLERAGYRVAIKGYCAASHADGYTSCVVTIKDADQYVQLATVATAVALPVYYRAVGFRYRAHAPINIGSGWGSPRYAEHDERVMGMLRDAGHVDENTIVLPETRNEKTCRTTIIDAIHKVEAMRPTMCR